jgi:hypothetical protein
VIRGFSMVERVLPRLHSSRESRVAVDGHIHQVMQKVEGDVTFHTARSTAFPQPAPTAPSPGPMKVPDDQLRKMLGIANVTFEQNEQRLAIVDSPLQG